MADIQFPGQAPIHTGDRKAKAHLDWLDQVVRSVEQMQMFINRFMGGTDGVMAVSGIGVDSGLVVAYDPTPNMQVKINETWGFVHDLPLYAGENVVAALDAPVSNDRIDTVSIIHPDDADTLSSVDPATEIFAVNEREIYLIRKGEEDVSPVAPSIGDNELKLAEIYHRPGETSIENADDATNGYITDFRVKKNF